MARIDRTLCYQHKDDCFANVDGRCTILNNTFMKNPCRFYKSQADYEQGLKDHPTTIFCGKDKYDFD